MAISVGKFCLVSESSRNGPEAGVAGGIQRRSEE